MQNSTTYQAVRNRTAPVSLRWSLGAIQTVAPGLAAWLGERLFFTPHKRALSAEARRLLLSGRRFSLQVEGRRVKGWRWGQGPVVYLVHGWGGHSGRLSAFVPPLVEAGFSVVTFDAPGHGVSGRGMSSMPEFARALRAVAAAYGAPQAIIAHSLGAAATGLAVHWGLRPRRLVLLAPPANPATYVEPFTEALGLTKEVAERLRTRSERRLRFRWSDLDVRRMAPAEPVPMLVVHDREDETVPFSEGAAVADTWDGRLHETTGLGHGGILHDPAVVSEVTSFVTEAAEPEAWPANDGARLEWALFNRDERW
ncbi:MAG TPA: alpha/beta fold hydrolase [Gemmatimonadales bacterium]|jgi:pimeloyl-ACP methyl ester carboxylesterase